MKIDGKAIADSILSRLKIQVAVFKAKDVIPTLAVILVGDDPGSISYIKQKQKAVEIIGAGLIFEHLPVTASAKTLASTIDRLNNDRTVHGIIIQRPVPSSLGYSEDILNAVVPAKDVDGFLPHSPFTVPVAMAVGEILQNIKFQISNRKYRKQDYELNKKFWHWLRTKIIIVIGRGKTAGKPIADYLKEQQCTTSIIHSHTSHPINKIRKADIIISCVGKKQVLTKRMIKPGSILLSVGIWRDSEGKLHGDYEEEDIQDIASFYTPTPGGVGPVNVACLMQNLVSACTMQI